MTTIHELWSFEIRYQRRQPLAWLSALVLGAIAVAVISSDVGIRLSDAPAHASRNSPYVICSLMAGLSILGLFVVTAFVATAALRDFEHGCEMLFFSRPITTRQYVLGRFLGAMTLSFALFVVLAAGLAIGQVAPWQDTSRIGPATATPILFGLLVFALPNLFTMGALFFAVAIFTRRMLWTYLVLILFVTMQDGVELLAGREDLRSLGAVLEPLGVSALVQQARYWTVAEFRDALPSLTGDLLVNRLVWLGVGAAALWAAVRRFRVDPGAKTRSTADDAVDPTHGPAATGRPPFVEPARGRRASIERLLGQCRFEVSWVTRSGFLIVCALLAMIVVAAGAWARCEADGDPRIADTALMVDTMRRALRPFLTVLVVFYAGELVWRDRGVGIAGLLDVTPAPSAGFVISRLVAIAAAVLVVILGAIASTLTVQLVRGNAEIDLVLYAIGAVVLAWPACILAGPCVLAQVIAPNKMLGYLLVVGFLAIRFALPALGMESPLYRFGEHPPLAYSGMDGYGPTATPFVWFSLYWSGVAALLLVASAWLWPRGEARPLRARLASRSGPKSAAWRWSVGMATACAVAFFAVVFVNTRVLNDRLDRSALHDRRARYERLYAGYDGTPLPRIVAVSSEVDLHPSQRRVEVRGRYRLVNDTAEPVAVLPITVAAGHEEGIFRIDDGVELVDIGLPDHRVVVDDRELGFHVFELTEPLRPGGKMDLEFEVRVEHRGFRDGRPNLQIVENGTFFTDRTVFPTIGFASAKRLLDPRDRRRHGLEDVPRTHDLDDPRGTARSYLQAHWIDCETVISTERDQTALTLGELEEEWVDGERRYARFRTSAPVQRLLAFASARYEVMRAKAGEVDVELYFHADHGRNAPRILEVAVESLTCFERWFGPYPHRTLRIAEIPATNGRIAVSLGSFIGFSESFGFRNDTTEGRLDSVAHVTAHEVAHQWWNHQFVPADCQGATFLGEGITEYTALLFLEETFDEVEVRRFRRIELDRYLRGRGRESRDERALHRVENQDYVHYHKGALAFSALQARVGRDAMIGALRSFLVDHRFAPAPYPRSVDLLERLRGLLPDDERDLVDDLFARITLYDLRVTGATSTRLPSGRYLVEVDVHRRRVVADGHGVEIDDGPAATPVVLEVRGEAGVLHRAPIVDDAVDTRVRVEVDHEPREVEIDPDVVMIDRVREDNRVDVRVVDRLTSDGE